MDTLMTPAERAERHRRWLESFGLSAEDWRRIHQLAADTTPNFGPAALDDLSVPVRVGACMADTRRHHSGELLGVIDGRAVVAWPMVGREVETWRAKRRARGSAG